MTARATDVVVVGAGIVGCATAWECARRGLSVVLLDRGEVSGATTGLGEGNVLCSDKDAGPELALTVLGRALYAELEEIVGPAARIRRKGALIAHPDARTWAGEAARAERLRAAGVACSLLEGPDAVRAAEPELTGELLGALHVPGDLQCDPRAIARGLATRAAEAHGAEVRTGAEVAEVVVAGSRAVGVRLASGETLGAGAVVLAAGPWTRPLAEGLGIALPLEPRKGQLTRLLLPTPDERFLRHKVVDGSYLLSVTSAAAGREVSTVIETTHDGHLIVGSTRERCGFDPTVDRALEDEVRTRAARLVPEIAGLARDTAWVGFRPWLPDHLPAIGPAAQVEGLHLATGHEGAGIALGPITGRLIAGAIAGEPPPLDLTPFAPDRFAAVTP
ncbi:D-amino acid dehydrogenase [Baekduia alba]|uniref:NAD(P)/FAD-dependent oxidoreductase n=1 Tax=Baekduia alba TaxID=2997333 RepID=UPI002340F15A|nr:FAD-binding oxidoreductase [Baekduia alba]WCB92999.1 D-amino acid dehydrogenase [Baekduia alba]